MVDGGLAAPVAVYGLYFSVLPIEYQKLIYERFVGIPK